MDRAAVAGPEPGRRGPWRGRPGPARAGLRRRAGGARADRRSAVRLAGGCRHAPRPGARGNRQRSLCLVADEQPAQPQGRGAERPARPGLAAGRTDPGQRRRHRRAAAGATRKPSSTATTPRAWGARPNGWTAACRSASGCSSPMPARPRCSTCVSWTSSRRTPDMAELTLQERLQPSLLDRLTDDEPGNLGSRGAPGADPEPTEGLGAARPGVAVQHHFAVRPRPRRTDAGRQLGAQLRAAGAGRAHRVERRRACHRGAAHRDHRHLRAAHHPFFAAGARATAARRDGPQRPELRDRG